MRVDPQLEFFAGLVKMLKRVASKMFRSGAICHARNTEQPRHGFRDSDVTKDAVPDLCEGVPTGKHSRRTIDREIGEANSSCPRNCGHKQIEDAIDQLDTRLPPLELNCIFPTQVYTLIPPR